MPVARVEVIIPDRSANVVKPLAISARRRATSRKFVGVKQWCLNLTCIRMLTCQLCSQLSKWTVMNFDQRYSHVYIYLLVNYWTGKNNKHTPCDTAWPSLALRSGVYLRSKTQQIWRCRFELHQSSSVDRLPSFEFPPRTTLPISTDHGSLFTSTVLAKRQP